MKLKVDYFQRDFHFNFKARTSRGLMNNKTSWFVRISDPGNQQIFGIGECGPLKGLSVDFVPGIEQRIEEVSKAFMEISEPTLEDLKRIIPPEFPSIQFAFETALLDFANGGKRILFYNDFLKGTPIPINGLIWMGDLEFMMNQINDKIAKGFRCIKLKVGGLDFDSEVDILAYLRRRYYRENITIRLDANGAFKLDDVLYKLEELARFNVHSIEQPIKAGQEEMEELCRKSPIPVAFDEELIGKYSLESKRHLIASLQPSFLILKPTLHGGIEGCREWIKVAEENTLGWWMTSALESNVGLNAICQFTAEYPVTMPHGLGTGAIYKNNIASPLTVLSGQIFNDVNVSWEEGTLSQA